MAIIKVKLPAMGEGITDAKIIRWLVEKGEKVEIESPLAEIATDKVDSEVLATANGTIYKLLKSEGDIVAVGEEMVYIESDDNLEEGKIEESIVAEKENNPGNYIKEDIQEETNGEIETIALQKHNFISPFLRTMAADYNIPIEELYSIKGTGKKKEITLNDVKQYILKRNSVENVYKIQKQTTFEPMKKTNAPLMIQQNLMENSEIIEMDRMRRLIADHMVRSKSISPHVTSFIEADVSNLVTWRNQVKEKFLENTGEKLTYTPIFVESVVKALQQFPLVNSSLDGNKIYIKKNINVGVATALKDGNLIVPVIKDADKKNLVGLAREVNDIVNRARQNLLTPTEIKGGTFTITNLGNFESLAGTPIINQPEVAILAIGAITRKPAVVKVNDIETIGIRDILMLSLAYDHRIIDGYLGGMFLKFIKDTLQNFNMSRKLPE